MRDDAEERLQALLAATRSHRQDTSALELHFETRLMARIRERKEVAPRWNLLVWRMIPAFALVALISLTCSLVYDPERWSDPFAALTASQDDQITRNYLAGE